jgi:hypothetical protein
MAKLKKGKIKVSKAAPNYRYWDTDYMGKKKAKKRKFKAIRDN